MKTFEYQKGVLIVIGVIVVFFYLARFSDNREPRTLPNEPQALPDVRHLLSSGNGHDWIQLSAGEKMLLCQLIAETLDRHTTVYYLEFFTSFYGTNNNLNMDIAEAAAVAAALD